MNIKHQIAQAAKTIFAEIGAPLAENENVQINLTPVDFQGDYTLVLFPFLKKTGKNPNELGELLGTQLQQKLSFVESFNIVKGFLNLKITGAAWKNILLEGTFLQAAASTGESVLIEYPSPNTNKPLHLGHLRNIFLGFSLSRILEENGKKVTQVCLYNDRGTNISKSMWAYLHADDQLTPENSGIKGDKLVGDYYVSYSNAYKEQVKKLIAEGKTEEEAKKLAPMDQAINEMTLKWEQGDEETRALWKMMNGWFYEGVAETYKKLGLSFAKEYYESDIYMLGKETVEEGLQKGIFEKDETGAVWIDLTDIGLDRKLLLRSNGTSVYITQDMALAYQKQKEFDFQSSIYVVGNEQDYHFKVLFEILRRLEMKASENLKHLSYGMVELPTGKMKSREGTVVDADDLIDEVIHIAKEKANEQGKLAEVSDEEKEKIYQQIGIGALRYFILKVDPVKKMIFNPEDSIDFNGNTAPFIQYIYARIQSLKRNAEQQQVDWKNTNPAEYVLNEKEEKLVRSLAEFSVTVNEAAKQFSPALVANYTYALASDFSTFYHDYKVLKEENEQARAFRMQLADKVGQMIQKGLYLLGIDAPERM